MQKGVGYCASLLCLNKLITNNKKKSEIFLTKCELILHIHTHWNLGHLNLESFVITEHVEKEDLGEQS